MFKKFLIILAIIFISSCQIKENLEEENFFVVIPHHNLVRKDIDEFYSFLSQKYSDKNIENIVVISPNHFNFN
ncbi:MAG: hypothetical protein LBF15_00865 [Candidatus Peribacteria bacterium]|jgi:predicted class III extradiol MEMO1 family dioxygenase|nr:hypothetical protein [Candidatus Peribacteria bacterium]